MEALALNLFVFNRETDEKLLSLSFSAKSQLNDSLLVPMISSIEALNKQLQNGSFREICGDNFKMGAYSMGKFTFLVQTKLSTSSAIMSTVLKDLGGLLEFLYGPSDKWDKDIMNLKGTQNIFQYFFERLQQDLGILIGGFKQLHVQKQVSDHLDWILMQFESTMACQGSNSMLLLDDVVLNTRIPIQISRNIIHLLKSKKSVKNAWFVPCYANGAWKSLYVYPMKPYSLIALTPLSSDYSQIVESMESCRFHLFHSRLDIPVEESDVQLPLRQFAKRDTLAVLYQNVKTGISMMPTLRPGPEAQTLEIMKGLIVCVNESSANMQMTGTTDWIVYRRQHMYFARNDGIDRLFLVMSLTNGNMGVEDVFKKADEIIKSIKKIYHQM